MTAVIATPAVAAEIAGQVGVPTLTTFAADVKLSPEIADALWKHLEVDPETDVEVAASIPQGILDDSLESFRAEHPFTAGVAGRISLLFSKLRASLAPPPVLASTGLVEVHAASEPASVNKGKVSMVLDQADDGTYEVLDPSKRAEYRNNHVMLTGGPPPEGRAPSSDQLAALASKLLKGEAPYADFAVFTPHGRRLHRLRKFDAQVFIDGALQTRALKGPCDYASWKACWEVFRAAMVSLGEISPATLDGYERGIATLVTMFPMQWGVIFCADEIVRSEVWQTLAEELQDSGAWPAARPWDKVVCLSTFGGADGTFRMTHWWKIHVESPCQRAGSAISFLQQIEGTMLLPMPDGMTTGSASGPPRSMSKLDRRKRQRFEELGAASSASSFPSSPAWQPPQDKGGKSWGGGKGGGGGSRNKGKGDSKGKGHGKAGAGKKGPSK